ncbi:hypothetical protein GCM10010357_56630 [Streptomyces luteireticuli]|uniref:Uncharacterized protein n=1 Tax=Streptomyces luteireticuli TaxID=173858 RepID=A0ABP3IUF2_9ACTN
MDAVRQGEGSEVEHVGGQEPEEGGTFQHGGNHRLPGWGVCLSPPRPFTVSSGAPPRGPLSSSAGQAGLPHAPTKRDAV